MYKHKNNTKLRSKYLMAILIGSFFFSIPHAKADVAGAEQAANASREVCCITHEINKTTRNDDKACRLKTDSSQPCRPPFNRTDQCVEIGVTGLFDCGFSTIEDQEVLCNTEPKCQPAELQRVCSDYNNDAARCVASANCFYFTSQNSCHPKNERLDCSTVPQDLCGTPTGTSACAWNVTTNSCIQTIEQTQATSHGRPEGYVGALPDCAFEGTCRNVNDVLQTLVNYAQGLFGFVGAFAFLFFMYGGFVMIISMGSPEKVKQGRDILAAAVIGIIITFSAYVAVGFLLDALQVAPEFRAINSVTPPTTQ